MLLRIDICIEVFVCTDSILPLLAVLQEDPFAWEKFKICVA